MRITKALLRKLISEEIEHNLSEGRASDLEKQIKDALGFYGTYALRSLLEDYEYYTSKSGGVVDTEGFLTTLKLSKGRDGIRLKGPDVELVWDEKDKKWVGFEGVAPAEEPIGPRNGDEVQLPKTYHPDWEKSKFQHNVKMLKNFPGAIDQLRSLFAGAGFFYEGEKIDFPTYLGIMDVYLDTMDGVPTVSVQDTEGEWLWDPTQKEWTDVAS